MKIKNREYKVQISYIKYNGKNANEIAKFLKTYAPSLLFYSKNETAIQLYLVDMSLRTSIGDIKVGDYIVYDTSMSKEDDIIHLEIYHSKKDIKDKYEGRI